MAKSPITCHVLDSSIGRPATGVKLSLQQYRESTTADGTSSHWELLAVGETNADGRCLDLLPSPGSVEAGGNGTTLKAGGLYKIVFKTKDYFDGSSVKTFYPWVEIPFEVTNPDEHYHIPLLLTPYSYTTYRGS